MKKLFAFLFTTIVLANLSTAQNSQNDVVLKTSGEELSGKVTEIGDDAIKFIHAGETLTYSIKKSDIFRITFSSGRIEFFNKAAVSNTPTNAVPLNSGASHHNKIAVLPFGFLADRQNTNENVAEQVQRETFSLLKNHSPGFTIVDPATVNALLIKAGINEQTMRGFTPAEICNTLGVEYIVEGNISQNLTSQVKTNSTYGSNGWNNNKSSSSQRNTFNSTSSSYTSQSFRTTVDMSIYNDEGETVYTDEHTSFWTGLDAYKPAIVWLLKKTPFYHK